MRNYFCKFVLISIILISLSYGAEKKQNRITDSANVQSTEVDSHESTDFEESERNKDPRENLITETVIETGRKYPKRIYNISKIEGKSPKIDGKLNEDCWRSGKWDGDYRQREPVEAATPEDPTELKILYDDQAIYVAIRAYVKDRSKMDKQIGRRDSFAGDMVGIAFDSYFDRRTAFEFNVTSGGSKVDLLAHPDGFDRSWNAVWDVAVGEEENAWVAEYRIPFSQLRFPPNVENRVWGLHSWRSHRKSNMESNWQIIPRDNSGFVYQFGELHGLQNIKPKRQIEILPYISGSASEAPTELGNPFKDGRKFQLETGVDAKIGVTNNLIVDLTINPDFGQVEADPSELNLGTVETFYKEQRPFFLEGKSLFEEKVQGNLIFYSRRIGKKPGLKPDTDGFSDIPKGVKIIGAAKLTGKTQNGLSVGGLLALASKEEASIYENGSYRTQTVEPTTKYAVTRLSQELNDGGTSIGGIITGTFRDLDEDSIKLTRQAITGGLDVSHKWWERTHFLKASWLGSHVEGSPEAITRIQKNNLHNFDRVDAEHVSVNPNRRELNGTGWNIEAGKNYGGNWRYRAEIDWRSPELELNDIGYLHNVDHIRQESSISYIENEPQYWYKNYRITLSQKNDYNYDGMLLKKEAGIRGFVKLSSNWNINTRIRITPDYLDTHRLRGGPTLEIPGFLCSNLRISTDSSKSVVLWSNIHFDKSFEEGGFLGIRPGIEIKHGSRFRLNFDVGYNKSDFDSQWIGSQSRDDLPTSYFVGKLDRETFSSTLRLDYNFTPDISLAFYGNLYFSSGVYSKYKLVTNARASQFSERFFEFEGNMWKRENDELFLYQDNLVHTVEDPDFNYRTLRSNLVFRWEYKTGSTFYAVWSHDRQNSYLDRHSNIGADLDHLIDTSANNTFLIKMSYWFSL